MTELAILCLASTLVASFYVTLVRMTDAVEPEPPLALLGAVVAGFFAYESALVVDVVALSAGASAIAHAAATTGAQVLAAALVAAASARLRGRRGSEIDGALDGAVYVGLVALGASLCESVRFALHGAGLSASLGLFQQALLGSLARLTLSTFAGMALGLAMEHVGALRRASIIASGALGSVGMAALLGVVEPTLSTRAWWPGALALLAGAWFAALAVLARRERAMLAAALRAEVARGGVREKEVEGLLRHDGALSSGRRRALVSLGWVMLRRAHGDASSASMAAEAEARDGLAE